MAHHVFAAEFAKFDAAHIGEHAPRLDKAAFGATRQVNLGDIAGDHRLGAKSDAREEHFHLLGRGVLRFVEDDEGVVKRASPHVGERRHFNGVTLEHLADLVKAHQIVECVVEWAQIRIDFLRQVARQKAEALTGFDGGAHENDALYRIAFELVHGAGDSQIGLARARRSDGKADVVLENRFEVGALARCTAAQIAFARDQHRRAAFLSGGELIFNQPQLDAVHRESVRRLVVEFLQQAYRARRLFIAAAYAEALAAAGNGDIQCQFYLAQVFVEGAAQNGEALIVDGCKGQFDRPGFHGGGAHVAGLNFFGVRSALPRQRMGCGHVRSGCGQRGFATQRMGEIARDAHLHETADMQGRPGEIDDAVVVGASGEFAQGLF